MKQTVLLYHQISRTQRSEIIYIAKFLILSTSRIKRISRISCLIPPKISGTLQRSLARAPQWIKQLLRIFGPELIRINSIVKTARSAVLKIRAERGFFFRRQPLNFENMTLVARRREHFCFFLATFLVAQLSPKRSVLVQKNSLASCQRCRHSVEPRALMCPFKHSDLIAWSLLIGHPTHKYLWGRLCFVHVCCLLSTVTVTPAETRIIQQKHFSQKRFRLRFTRSAPVYDLAFHGVHKHPAVAVRNSWRR